MPGQLRRQLIDIAFHWGPDPTPSISNPIRKFPTALEIVSSMAEPSRPSKDDLPDHLKKELERREGR